MSSTELMEDKVEKWRGGLRMGKKEEQVKVLDCMRLYDTELLSTDGGCGKYMQQVFKTSADVLVIVSRAEEQILSKYRNCLLVFSVIV